MSVGGIGNQEKEADSAIHEACQKVRTEIESKVNRTFTEFKPLTYKSQLVNGVNYFIKVKVDGDEHLHVRIHKTFQGEVTLASIQEKKKLQDEISYF